MGATYGDHYLQYFEISVISGHVQIDDQHPEPVEGRGSSDYRGTFGRILSLSKDAMFWTFPKDIAANL